MKRFALFLGLIALASAQFPPGFPNVPGVAPPPWQGPIADHINGIPPQDTPEVAAAKRALNQAYSQVLAVLPILPPEERYRETQVPVQQPIFNQGSNINQYQVNQGQYIPQQNFPTPSPVRSQPQVFAEEIPRSNIGEVPEVHAARVAHLKAVQEAQAALPPLTQTPVVNYNVPQTYVPQAYVPQAYNPQVSQFVQDTPEVARAKAEHAAAVAALG